FLLIAFTRLSTSDFGLIIGSFFGLLAAQSISYLFRSNEPNWSDSTHHGVGENLMTFDYIVSNPPFKLDFSDWRDDLDTKKNSNRFFAGIPKITPKSKDKMAIYLLFIQHIIFSLSPKGKAAVVVPTGFITAQSGIEKKIRQKLIDDKMIRGVVSMPSNIFATTGTNVSVLFLDKSNLKGDLVLMDASNLGTTVKEGKNQKTLLSSDEEQKIITTFNSHLTVEDFAIVVSYDQVKEKNYSLSAGQYFDVKIEYTDITAQEFEKTMHGFKQNIETLFKESKNLEDDIKEQLAGLKYE
ncbi:MAG: N-6 DNA methylase, partial [Candidatus Marinimicrobia bacterium]|nr:N-6 DNA methylase [Candidatus Neomarinimicrobiota bacterium]MBT5315037.1 N-6 DNA methylase [Candidatus Neomarinimicrobiota bacterium]MBT7200707.1 N-6 DNA methylase [Candidatus Neomarinimicrobiota bacterium]